jgi:hypothetical protein
MFVYKCEILPITLALFESLARVSVAAKRAWLTAYTVIILLRIKYHIKPFYIYKSYAVFNPIAHVTYTQKILSHIFIIYIIISMPIIIVQVDHNKYSTSAR